MYSIALLARNLNLIYIFVAKYFCFCENLYIPIEKVQKNNWFFVDIHIIGI